MTFNDTHDEYFSVPVFISSTIILVSVTDYREYTLLQYTIFQLKIISDLYFRMFNTNIVNYQIYKK